MPAKYEIDVARRLVLSKGWDELSDEDLRRADKTIRDDQSFDPSFRELCDLQMITKVTASVETIRVVAQSRRHLPGAKRALVAPLDVSFGLARMFQAYSEAEGQTVEVFRKMSDAEAWLGLTSET